VDVDRRLSREDLVAVISAVGAAMHGVKRLYTAEQEEIDQGSSIILGVLFRHGPKRPSDIAQICGLDLSTVSRHARVQEEAGRVAKVADPADRRAHRLALTDAGIERFDQLWRRRIDRLAEIIGEWSPEDARTLTVLAERLAGDLGEKVPVALPDPDLARATHRAALAQTLPKGA
jgi:DNA-binding MarR family transcriptional regulator